MAKEHKATEECDWVAVKTDNGQRELKRREKGTFGEILNGKAWMEVTWACSCGAFKVTRKED